LASNPVKERRNLVHLEKRSAEPFRSLRLTLELRPDARRVLLIDADLRNPSLHEFFGLPRSPGLVELLGSDEALPELTHAIASPPDLEVLTAGSALSRAADVAASVLMAKLLRQASATYDIVVVDSPPVLLTADAAGLASHPGTDVVVVVKRGGKRRPVLRALRRLDLIGANVLGIVVNRDEPVASYAYS
jgi:Mrp family chromosome partitioning ATPase